jgi:hypothetical protein
MACETTIDEVGPNAPQTEVVDCKHAIIWKANTDIVDAIPYVDKNNKLGPLPQ